MQTTCTKAGQELYTGPAFVQVVCIDLYFASLCRQWLAEANLVQTQVILIAIVML